MSRRPRGSGGGRAGRGGGRASGGVAPPALEVPLQIPGLKAWFDSRNTSYFALGGGGEVSAWLSRDGSISGLAWTQGTASNQPIRIASVPLFNNMPAVLLDGSNDRLLTSDLAAWPFLHDGTGQSIFRVYRTDSTGGVAQALSGTTTGGTSTIGFRVVTATATSLLQQVVNGSGVNVVNWTINTAAHYARDVTRWHLHGYGAGTSHSRVSGSSLTQADTGGAPSLSVPSSPHTLGSSTSGSTPFKGFIAQEIYYDHVLTAGETTQLANWAAATYGVAA